jgi:hypothetical protein
LFGFAYGDAPACKYIVNDRDYIMGYYLADGIYPSLSTFGKTIQHPSPRKKSVFPKLKKHTERILREILACHKLNLLLFDVSLISGTRSPSTKW